MPVRHLSCKRFSAKTSWVSVSAVPDPTVVVSDPRALRALAHPLRNRLLGLLRRDGPATATQLGRAVDESSGSTSYHLRQLAAHGFIEDAPGQGRGRERVWRARHRLTSWEAGDLLEHPGGREVAEEMLRRQLDAHARLLAAWTAQRDDLGPTWRAASSLSDAALRLTPAQARALADELDEVLARHLAAHDPAVAAPDSELVAVLLDVLPLRTWP